MQVVPPNAAPVDSRHADWIDASSRGIEGLVSIVMPTYRGDRYIGATLATIAAQRYSHWELLVVEDGPGGATESIVMDFARLLPEGRVTYARNARNQGAAYSRNVAFSRARGEYVALLDCDDRWQPNHLAQSVEALSDPAIDVVYSSVLMFEDETELLLDVWGPKPADVADFPYSLFHRNFVTPSATVLRRRVLADVGPWDSQFKYCEDLDFWLRCAAAGVRFQHIGGCHCLYRKNHAGATTSRDCGTREELARILAHHLPEFENGSRDCRRRTSKAFVRAAIAHAEADAARDASADASRARELWLTAWKLNPRRVNYLAKAAFARRIAPRQTQRANAEHSPTTIRKAAA
jgi:glycosyltransferase involved in cell wall biosynthesis